MPASRAVAAKLSAMRAYALATDSDDYLYFFAADGHVIAHTNYWYVSASMKPRSTCDRASGSGALVHVNPAPLQIQKRGMPQLQPTFE